MDFTIWYTRRAIKDLKGSTKTFYFKSSPNAFIRSRDGMVTVYCLTPNGEPLRLGIVEYSTAGYPGERPAAVQLIGRIFGYKNDNYHIKRKDIKIYEVY